MKLSLKAVMAVVLAMAITGGGLLAFAGAASATPTAPVWEPDPATASYGNLLFFDGNGDEITSGTNLSNPFDYVVADTAADTGATKATVSFYDPATGEAPSAWTGFSGAGPTTFSPASSLPSGTPASIVNFAPTYPVVASSAASITNYLGSAVNCGGVTTPACTVGNGYANIIEVRLTDSGSGGKGNPAGTYWETDIGYNTTSSAITIDGTSVPANGWAQLFPFQTPSSVTLTTSASGGSLLTGSNITLTATITAPSGATGGCNYFANGTFLDFSNTCAPYTYAPATGSYVYTVAFDPGDAPGLPTETNTTSATIVAGSISSGVTVNVAPPATATTDTLSVSNNSITYGTSVTLTSTVTAADGTTPAGTDEFLVGTAAISGCTAVATNTGGTSSPAQCTTTSLPQGSDSITDCFTPTSSSYAASCSAAVVIQVAAPAVCSLSGSSCSDTQNIQVTINPGTITITTPYTASNPFVLPAMQLSSDGTYFYTSAQFPANALPLSQQIVVTSSLAPAYAWTLSVSATPLTNGGGGTIPASGLGLTGGTLWNSSGTGAYPGTVTFHNIPALNPSPVDGPGTGPGLSSTPQSWASSTAADGTAEMYGTLTLYASTATPAGTYNGTITFGVS